MKALKWGASGYGGKQVVENVLSAFARSGRLSVLPDGDSQTDDEQVIVDSKKMT